MYSVCHNLSLNQIQRVQNKYTSYIPYDKPKMYKARFHKGIYVDEARRRKQKYAHIYELLFMWKQHHFHNHLY